MSQVASLSYVNIFARDIVALSGFYQRIFGFPEIEAIRSPIFVGIDAGGCNIGFNAREAYAMLELSDRAETQGVQFLLNFDVEDAAAVDRFAQLAVAQGASLIKPPYRTYYGWYQAVLVDPEDNIFRINTVLE